MLLAATKVDLTVFVAAAAMVLAGAIGVVVSGHPVHAALSLVLTLFGVAVLFVAQEAHFLAAVQVIVYAGAIVVLFLFVIMLLGVDRQENVRQDPLRAQRPVAVLLGLASLAAIVLLAQGTDWVTGARSVAGPADGPGANVEKLAESIFTRYLLAFEITSVLLVIAVVGAVVLARRSSETSGETTTAAAGQGTHTAEEAGDGDPGRGESTVPVP
ncbi:MAG: NADH-quinone oxidoreductase subunit J family protein [Acidimicrobiales bacterium]